MPTVFGNSVGQASARVVHADRRYAGGCSLTRENLAAGYADCARLVDQSGKKGWEKLDGSAAQPASPGVDLAPRGSASTVVTRANAATLFPSVPDSRWPLQLSETCYAKWG